MKPLAKFSILLAAVLMVATPMSLSAQDKTIKRKVAIGRFTNETQYAKGLFYDKENDPMRKQALDILSSKLAASEKFILLERDDLDILVAEAGEGMNKIGADYIILGSITEFGRKAEGQQKVFSSTKTQTVEAGVSIRLVEAATGLIIYSDEAKGFAETTTKQTLGVGGTAGFDATLSDKAISAALSQLVENIINKCMDKPWRSYILLLMMVLTSFQEVHLRDLQSGIVSMSIRKGKSSRIRRLASTLSSPDKRLEPFRFRLLMATLPKLRFLSAHMTEKPLMLRISAIITFQTNKPRV